MTQGLARYHSRSPRYILDTDDNYLIRVAGPRQTPWEEGTEIKNVSLTGLAFTAPEDLCPILGEVIKIQFQVPGQQNMACYGIVTRIENEEASHNCLVAIHFYKLEMAHRLILAQGLTEKLKHRNKDVEDLIQSPFPWVAFAFHVLVLSTLLGTWAWVMMFFIHSQTTPFLQWGASFIQKFLDLF